MTSWLMGRCSTSEPRRSGRTLLTLMTVWVGDPSFFFLVFLRDSLLPHRFRCEFTLVYSTLNLRFFRVKFLCICSHSAKSSNTRSKHAILSLSFCVSHGAHAGLARPPFL